MDQMYGDDEARWQALRQRDPKADGHFYYSVASTGVYCRPGCASRLPLRHNVQFHDTLAEAARLGFRACKRCCPGQESLSERQREVVLRACRLLDECHGTPSLEALAASVDLSVSHFHRLFRKIVGLTPAQYARARRAATVKTRLRQEATVTRAIHGAGYYSSGHFHASDPLGMTPEQYRQGGAGITLRYAIAESWLGPVLVAGSGRGLCKVQFGDHPQQLERALREEFPQASLEPGDGVFAGWVAAVIGQIEHPGTAADLPLDVRGTAFQHTVWEALRAIPLGQTRSYLDIARQIGQPQAARAVARACASNTLAVVVPCHRVVGSDGKLRGYRWGVERKQRLLERELPGDA